MSRRTRLTLAMAVPVLAPTLALSLGVAPASAGDSPRGAGISYAQGPAGPEDIAALPGSDNVVISGMVNPTADAPASPATGHLYLKNSRSGKLTEVWPQRPWTAQLDAARYPSCPGAPDPTKASPHGINVEVRREGGWTIYVVNHGGREAIEVFHLDSGRGARLTWEGCVPLPKDAFGNGVAPLGDGLLVTAFSDPTQGNPFTQIFSKEPPTGRLLRWSRATGWSTVPGSRMYGANGVEVTQDGRTAFVAEWGRNRVHRIPLVTDPHRWERAAAVNLPYMPDNLRWDRRGRLLVTGQDYTPAQVASCQKDELANCPTGIVAHAIDPARMSATEIFRVKATDFRVPTVVEDVGNSWWVGSVKGDKIGVVDARGPRNR